MCLSNFLLLHYVTYWFQEIKFKLMDRVMTAFKNEFRVSFKFADH